MIVISEKKERVVDELISMYLPSLMMLKIQLLFLQPLDSFSQTKLHWKALNESYLHIYGMFRSNDTPLRY